jgi:hypothetical protein
MTDLRDDQVFQTELAKCTSAESIRALCTARAEQMSLVSKDSDGIYHVAPGVDERVQVGADQQLEKTVQIGSKKWRLVGTAREIAGMERGLIEAQR